MATINYKDPVTNTWKEIPIGGPETDSSLSSTSTNPVQNKVINSALDNKVNTTTTVNGHPLSSNVTITKGDISLGNVDNTSDLNKPISTATQTALNGKQGTITAGTNISKSGNTISVTLTKMPANSNTSQLPLILASSASTSATLYYTSTSNVSVKNSDGTIYAKKFVASSDKRLKENFEEFNPKKSILDLPIYSFNFKGNTEREIGCIAQDLEEICPEIVKTNEATGYLSIEEQKIVYLLLDEVKKLKKEIEELKEDRNGRLL